MRMYTKNDLGVGIQPKTLVSQQQQEKLQPENILFMTASGLKYEEKIIQK